MSWLRADGDDVILSVHVQPGAKHTEITGLHGAALKIRLAAPPVDGKANDALIAFLAAAVGVTRARVSLVSGHAARLKRVRIADVPRATVEALLPPAQ